VLGISVKEESISIPTTASEIVMTVSTIPSTAVSQNKTISDQQDFNASWLGKIRYAEYGKRSMLRDEAIVSVSSNVAAQHSCPKCQTFQTRQ
jgi:hypothetical protein